MSDGERSYLDFNATAPLRPEAAEAFARAMRVAGNPSSIHAEGRAARAVIEQARADVAALVGAPAASVVFTSGGTEACALALSPAFHVRGWAYPRLIVGAVEHVCVLEGHRFPADRVRVVGVDAHGRLDLDDLGRALDAEEGVPALLALQVANNETGVLQPVAEAASLVRERGGAIVADAVQAAGRMRLDIGELGVDALVLSGHKFGAPKGVGALILASGAQPAPLVVGGGQERGHRGGTENVPGIAGFGAAARAVSRSLAEEAAHMRRLRDAIEDHILRRAPASVIFGREVERLPNTVAFATPGLKAQTSLIAFDLEGVAVSSGSACSSGKVRRSHVLSAMGVDPARAEEAIRVSVGAQTGDDDVIRFAAAYEKVLAALSSRRERAA